jgi:large subunit ribosomal protein L13
VKEQIVGRAATVIAQILQGKSKFRFARNADMGDVVVAINVEKVVVSGNKAMGKEYETYSGYPGGRKTETFSSLIERKPDEVLRRAVRGMIPKNTLRDKAMKRFVLFVGSDYVLPVEYRGLAIKTVTI